MCFFKGRNPGDISNLVEERRGAGPQVAATRGSTPRVRQVAVAGYPQPCAARPLPEAG